jgi:GAF domain-containing protein
MAKVSKSGKDLPEGDTLEGQIANAENHLKAMEAAVEHIWKKYQSHSWVGIYLLEGDTLVLGPWKGKQPTIHTRIPIGMGICGSAARTRETVIVDDVSKDPRYLECFLDTKSEIVVPICKNGNVLGEIDVDGDRQGAFGESDRHYLELIAEQLASRLFEHES